MILNLEWVIKEITNRNELKKFIDIKEFLVDFIIQIKKDLILKDMEKKFSHGYKFCHTDLHPGNILIDESSLEITGNK